MIFFFFDVALCGAAAPCSTTRETSSRSKRCQDGGSFFWLFRVCFVLAPSRPRLMSRDTCLFPNIFLLSPFSLSNVPLVSKECQALSFFFFSLASLGRLSHRRTLRDWAVSVCIHFPRRFKYLCYTAAAPSCVPLICSFSLLLFLLFIHVQFFKSQKLVKEKSLFSLHR